MARSTIPNLIHKLNYCKTKRELWGVIFNGPLSSIIIKEFELFRSTTSVNAPANPMLSVEEFYMLILFYAHRYSYQFTHFSYEDL